MARVAAPSQLTVWQGNETSSNSISWNNRATSRCWVWDEGTNAPSSSSNGNICVCVCVMVDLYARIMTMSNFIGQVVVGFYEKFCFSILSPMIACAHVVNTRPSVHHSSFRRTFRVDRGYHEDGLSLIDSSNSIWPKNNLFRFINEIMDRMEQHEFV